MERKTRTSIDGIWFFIHSVEGEGGGGAIDEKSVPPIALHFVTLI